MAKLTPVLAAVLVIGLATHAAGRALDVSLDPVVGRSFAALRSMFVMETNADVARIAWREPGGKAWRETPIDRFERASAVELRAARAVPSRHNSSAPDLRFSAFGAAPR